MTGGWPLWLNDLEGFTLLSGRYNWRRLGGRLGPPLKLNDWRGFAPAGQFIVLPRMTLVVASLVK